MDGGIKWLSQWLYDLCYADNQIGIAVGANGCIVKTTNGGTDWEKRWSGQYGLMTEVVFTDHNHGYVTCGGDGQFEPKMAEQRGSGIFLDQSGINSMGSLSMITITAFL